MSVGQVFLGKYRVDAILGHGGMGVVAECTHLALNQRVAIKMLRPDVLSDRDAVERFTREAQAASKLRGEHVAKVTDVGQFENGVPYMVMEFLDGQDLGVLLSEQGVLSVGWAVELVVQAAEALAEAHACGIVHRDVKPTNLFVNWLPDGTSQIKVLDFGISKSRQGADMQLTQTQSLLGTPAYMSPEQMRSARLVDLRTDIWSLGTVMYELLEGRRPFEAESFSEMCVKVAVDPPAPMVNTPPGLQPVILRCLAKTPEQRYATMAELGRDLAPFARDTHQALVLVERMERMARRSAGEWDGSSSASGTPPPRDSAPAIPMAGRASRGSSQAFGAGSDPAGQAWHGGSAVGAPAYVPQQPSAGMPVPAARVDRQSTPHTIADVRPRRGPLLVIALLAIAGIAVGLYFAFGRTGAGGAGSTAAAGSAAAGSAEAAAPAGSAATPTPAISTAAAGSAAAGSATPPAIAAGSAAAPAVAAGSAAAPAVAGGSAAVAGKPIVEPEHAIVPHGHTTHRLPHHPHETHHAETVKATTPPPPPQPPCDPFSNEHGHCPK